MKIRIALASAAVLALAALSACTASPAGPPSPSPSTASHSDTPDPRPAIGWWQGTDVPLTARQGAITVWTGDELLVIGGALGPPCPPNASCVLGELAGDGAAYDPDTDTWRAIAPPPSPLALGTGVYAAGRIYISALTTVADTPTETATVVLSYDLGDDSWHPLDLPDGVSESAHWPVADGDHVIFLSPSDENAELADFVYDAVAQTWSRLPADPIGRAYDRAMTPTPYGIVLTAKELVPNPGSEEPSFVVAALFDRESQRWTMLPPTEQIGGWTWAVYGDVMVDPQIGGADGGQVGNWGREYPYGGVLSLPDGRWSPLPPIPRPRPHMLGDVIGGRYSLSSGYLYDARDRTWTPIDTPFDANSGYPPTALWDDERLIVVGGGQTDAERRRVWLYTPEHGV